jgi:hypothetical protein
VPGLINYQGTLTDDTGSPLDGIYSIHFYLYDAATGGDLLWDEEQSVAVSNGVYNVQLGAVAALSSGVFSGYEAYLEVVIYNESTDSWEILSPKQRLTCTAYAFQAANAETLEGYGSGEFAPVSHKHSGADITYGTIADARIPVSIARDTEITWSNLSGIPTDIADGDDVGIATETDPTVNDSVKDGVEWTEVSNRPAGLDDGDDVGLTSETDPQVGANTLNYVPKWSGSALVKGMIYDSGTSVGIGTASPGEQLELTGNLRLPPTTTTTGIIRSGSNTLIHSYGTGNFFAGMSAGNLSMAGDYNTASGSQALHSNTTGNGNTASGHDALRANTEGNGNTASGYYALRANTTGVYNTASGSAVLRYNTEGYDNTASGHYALFYSMTGIHNTAFGTRAGKVNITGNGNTFIGCDSDASANDLINATAIGYSAVVNGSNRVRIGNTYVNQIGGQVGWSNLSDIRKKKDITDITLGLDFINSLRPVAFRLIEGNDRVDFGFIAQDIEAILGTDDYNILGIGGEPERTLSLRYTDFIAPMVKAIQEQEVHIHDQQEQIEDQQAYIKTLEKRLSRLEARLGVSR